jgi:RNA polymerase sigma-70 factor (ECF subfamily)
MPHGSKADTDELIGRAKGGDFQARQQLLVRHRDRLRRMIAVRMDRRLAARVDPSDVVQDVLTDAAQELSRYLRRQPLAFYPWLRQLAWDRLIELHRRHVRAGKRSVSREEAGVLDLPDESAVQLAARLLDTGSSPSERLLRQELRERVRSALARLSARDRELLVLRHLEQLPTKEIAAILGIADAAVKKRHVRALDRLQRLLGHELGEDYEG